MKAILVSIILLIAGVIMAQPYGFEPSDVLDDDYIPDGGAVLTQVGGLNITSSGTVRACFIFVDSYEDINYNGEVWEHGEEPPYMDEFVDSSPFSGSFCYENYSQYMYYMSNGTYQVIGDCYFYTLSNTVGSYGGDLDNSNYEVIANMDTIIDYSLYDNWTRTYVTDHWEFENVPDGYADMIYIIYRIRLVDIQPGINGTAHAGLDLSPSYTSNESIQISGTCGITQGTAYPGFEWTKFISLHEYGHYLLGGHTGRLCNLSLLPNNQVGYGHSRGMCAYERERLGWITYNEIDTDMHVSLSDYMTTGTAIKIPTDDDDLYYIIENRMIENNQNSPSPYDKAFGRGIYIYAVNENGITGYNGKVRLLSADGRWDFENNAAEIHSQDDMDNLFYINRTIPNIYGMDEMDYYGTISYGGGTHRYYCLNRWYDGDNLTGDGHCWGDAWGDNWDAFTPEYNNVFSEWSNPGLISTYNADFTVVVESIDPLTGIANLWIKFTNPAVATPPSKVMNLDGNHLSTQGRCNFTWWYNSSPEPDFSHFSVEFQHWSNSNWYQWTTTTSTSISVPTCISVPGNPGWSTLRPWIKYRIRAVDTEGLYSCSSEVKKIYMPVQEIPELTLGSSEGLTIDDSVTVHITSSMTIGNGGELRLGTGSQLIIDSGATLTIGNDVVISGTNASADSIDGSKLTVYGSITFGSDVEFNALGDDWDGIELINTSATISGGTFTSTPVEIDHSTFEASETYFTDSALDVSTSNFTLDKCDLVDSPICAFHANELGTPKQVTITDCDIENTTGYTAVFLSGYPKFNISGNTIEDDYLTLRIEESGSGSPHLIEDNTIINCPGTAIVLYHSYADIEGHNSIYDNLCGIVALNNSNWKLVGDKDYPIQRIHDNSHEEIIFTVDSTPDANGFACNEISDDDTNHTYPLIRCTGIPASLIDVSGNYWGTNFNAAYDFDPVGYFTYLPIWNPGIPKSSSTGDAATLYSTATESEVSGDYTTAETTYQSVISTYPESEYATLSAKALLSLETDLGNDYTTLQTYYETVETNNPGSNLAKTCDYLANYCNIKMLDYATAITWFEDVIQNPPTEEDSVFAVIDAGYTYLLMEDGSRQAFTGKIAELKPASKAEFEAKKAELLGMFWNDSEEADNVPSVPVLSMNYPNPFNPTTTICFSVPEESKVEMDIYNIKGQRVKKLVNDDYPRGNHKVEWQGVNETGRQVSSSVYFYRLKVNGKSIGVKKMLMLK